MVYHLPIFKSQAEADRVYAVCGRIALNWGPVEMATESVLVRLRNNEKYGTDPESFKWLIKFPSGYERKVREIKLHLRSPKYDSARDQATILLSKCKQVHTLRCDVVHSICQGTNLEGKVVLGRSDHNRGVAYKDKNISLECLESAAGQMLHLPADLTDLFRELSSPASR